MAAGAMVAGAFAPWARVTVGALGSGSPVLVVDGTRIGLDLGMAPWGWVVLAAGAVGAVGLLGDATLAIAAGFAGAVAADSGWRAVYQDPNDASETELSRVAAWALVEDETGSRQVVGLVTDGARLVPAAQAGTLLRYGYKG